MKRETKQLSGIVAKVQVRNSGSGIINNSFDGRELHCGEGSITDDTVYHGKGYLLFLAFRSSNICIENIHDLFVCETLFDAVLCTQQLLALQTTISTPSHFLYVGCVIFCIL